ncbi:hypothetical protein BJ508DRAFT_377641 [Ascobolus immersus RN42]|uniref:F-box domain-containing protein n=1 Tax=Ascobolus immersus RN42 TaxID=1160509 RepID=A0A3N4I0C8_ASCIM|nr:hypothetical protein BJ508DRAFT_377641 [Ascobolus immersus RN42]
MPKAKSSPRKSTTSASAQPSQRSLRARPGRASHLVATLPSLKEIVQVLAPEPKPTKRKQASPDPEYENHTAKRSKTGEKPTKTLLDLPSELIQEICFQLPYASDAVPVMHTCRRLYTILDSYFWFVRRRIVDKSERNWHFAKYTGVVKRDMTEKYNEKKDYKVEILRAFHGRTGGRTGENSRSDDVNEGKKKKKKAKDDILRCQICLKRRAYTHRNEIQLNACPECYNDNRIEQSELKFITGLRPDQCRITYERTRFSRIPYLWKPDVERQIRNDPSRFNNKSLDQLLLERQMKQDALFAETQRYRESVCGTLKEHFRQQWALPRYDKYREVFGDIEDRIHAVARHATFDIRITKNERAESWYRSKIPDLFTVSLDTPEKECPFPIYGNKKIAIEFHTRRLEDEYEAKVPPLEPGTTMGSYVAGICKICFEAVALRRSMMDLDSIENQPVMSGVITQCRLQAEHDRGLCRYLPIHELVEHGLKHHLAEMMSIEKNEGRQWQLRFLESVEGNQPVRVRSTAYWACHPQDQHLYPEVRMPPPGLPSPQSS